MPFQRPHQIADSTKVKQVNGSFEIEPKGLNIVWGNDPRYWKVPENGGPATLIQVCWLEVSGSVRVQRGKKYKIGFQVLLKPDLLFGWNSCPLLVMAKVGRRGSYTYKEVALDKNWTVPKSIPGDSASFIIDVPEGTQDPTIYFGLYEVWSGKWKGGLQIYKATVDVIH